MITLLQLGVCLCPLCALFFAVFFLQSSEAKKAFCSCGDKTTVNVEEVVCGTEQAYNYLQSTNQCIYHRKTAEKALMFSLHQCRG